GEAWRSLYRSLLDGQSWSGHERATVRFQLRPDRRGKAAAGADFADASFAGGLDVTEDGRTVVAVDWDADGDPDLWLGNRSGPRLRFLRNDAATGHSVSLRLRGTSANRDAVGSWVELHAGRLSQQRAVVAGDGYLSQSSP